MQPHPLREPDKFVVRLPEGMRSTIAEMAKSNRRSMNSEIVFHLEQAMASQRNTNKTAPTGVTAPAGASPEA
ncbi:MAG: Arc family DNA-binding protein [Methylorubrum populi]